MFICFLISLTLMSLYILLNAIWKERKREYFTLQGLITTVLLEIINDLLSLKKLTKNIDQNQNKEYFRHVDWLQRRGRIGQDRLLVLSLICTYIHVVVIGQTMGTWMHFTNFSLAWTTWMSQPLLVRHYFVCIT